MAENTTTDAADAILTQIRDAQWAMRDEMGQMRASFGARFDGLESKIDDLRDQFFHLKGVVDALEARIDAMEARHEERIAELFRRFSLMEADLKKYVGVTSEVLQHFGEEFDSVRRRLARLEAACGIAAAD